MKYVHRTVELILISLTFDFNRNIVCDFNDDPAMKFRANIVFLFGTMLMIITGCAKSSSIHLFNDDWYFKITDEPVHEQNADLESWESVSIPHTPMIEPKVMKGQWQGICWYQKTFEVPLKHKGQRLLMKFDGAMNTCDVWINGIKVATHMGGYLPVVFDFTHAAVFGKKNKVLVRLNNNDNPVTGPKPMHLLDFNMYGGLYRDVVLIIKNPLHITDPVLAAKPASGGVFVTYPEVSATEAIVQVKTHVANSGKKAKTYSVQNELWYGKQMVASVLSVQGLIKEDEQAEIISKLMVRTPKLWSPRSPSLYTLKTKLLSKGQVVDEVSTRIGIRRIEISKDSFSVNGEKMFLRGVNRHQDYPYIGYALSMKPNTAMLSRLNRLGSTLSVCRITHMPLHLWMLVMNWAYWYSMQSLVGNTIQTAMLSGGMYCKRVAI
jgi:beta-galactosidase